MPNPSSHEVTQLLQAWSDGNEEALDQLVPLVYGELHRLARHHMRGERPGHTLPRIQIRFGLVIRHLREA